MADQTIRDKFVAVLVKLETTEGTDAAPTGAADAIPVEADSVRYNAPVTTEQSNEATGSLVAGAPLVIGQAATISFRSRIKGAGPSTTYTSTVKPPIHAPLSACGWRGQFTAAVSAAVATAGTGNTVTLATGFPATARALLGMVLLIGAGTGSGNAPAVIEYTAGRVATLDDSFSPALDTTSSISLPANWTYAPTSPADATARATDHPSATIYVYRDGTLRKFTACRGTVDLEGSSARPGYANFTFTGIYAGKVDAAIPTTLTLAGHSAPTLLQGSALTEAVLVNRKPLAISSWTAANGGDVESIVDPNTPSGFGAGQIVDRTPTLRMDPYATLVANRDTVADIQAGNTAPITLRHGSIAGNRWALVCPQAQPVSADPGTRDSFESEDTTWQLRSIGRDSVTRDSDRILCFY